MFLNTYRLILRPWIQSDLKHFAEMNRDPDVRKYFPTLLTEEESNLSVKKFSDLIDKQGWGFFAVVLKETNEFIGMIGLNQISFEAPFSPAVEIGWRLSKKHWGKGYAKEGALACLKYAFETLQLDEVVSFTAKDNLPSQSVMINIGMQNTHQNFLHPLVADDNPLKEHVLYKMNSSEWKEFINHTKVYQEKPQRFFPSVEIAAIYVTIGNDLLLLKNNAHKREPFQWGVPAGKIEENEPLLKSVARELYEETGLKKDEYNFKSIGALYLRKPDVDYVYHCFCLNLKEYPEIIISNEHSEYKWVSFKDIEGMNLMSGAVDALNFYYSKTLTS